MNDKQKEDWIEIITCEYMCGRLYIMNHGQNGLPHIIGDKNINRLKKMYRLVKESSSSIRKLYFEFVVLNNNNSKVHINIDENKGDIDQEENCDNTNDIDVDIDEEENCDPDCVDDDDWDLYAEFQVPKKL